MPNTNEENNDKLVPLTVRFTGPAIDTIRAIAKEHGFSAAEIIRFTMDIIDLEKAIANVGRELNRICVNYNQEVKLHNIEKKRKESGDSGELIYQKNQIKKADLAFDKHEVEALF